MLQLKEVVIDLHRKALDKGQKNRMKIEDVINSIDLENFTAEQYNDYKNQYSLSKREQKELQKIFARAKK